MSNCLRFFIFLTNQFSVCDVTGKGSVPLRVEGGRDMYTYSTTTTTTTTAVKSNNSSSNNSNHNHHTTVANRSCGGFLTYLFEADERFNLELGISYTHSATLATSGNVYIYLLL